MSATNVTLRYPAASAGRVSATRLARLLRLELRHSVLLWMAPILGALFYFTTYRSVLGLPALWDLRAITALRDGVAAFAPFVAGAAAWMGSRDGRRATGELVAVSARSRWSTRVATWAATTCWATAIYLVCIGVLYGVTASQATWGGPPLWPVVVGVSAVAALAAVGFAAGAVLPSRFTAPLTAAIALLVVEAPGKVHFASDPFTHHFTSSRYPLLIPTSNQPLPFDAGVFSHFSPGVEILQAILLAALAVTVLGALGLPAGASGAWSRRAAVLLTLLGLAGVSTGAGLVGTARLTAHGVEIPALFSKADARTVPYTPACSHSAATPVCVHPAFRSYLPQITAALARLLHEVAGLPGAPVRAEQVADLGTDAQRFLCYYPGHSVAGIGGGIGGSLSGTPPVFHFFVVQLPGTYGLSASSFAGEAQLTLAQALTGGCGLDPAQQAVRAALLKAAGVSLAGVVQSLGPLTTSAYAAATRFASLPPATRHAWFQSHLVALRAGRLTTAQIP
jgi:hypothetical protein